MIRHEAGNVRRLDQIMKGFENQDKNFGLYPEFIQWQMGRR